MKILIAPLHYTANSQDGSEYTRAYDYLQFASKQKDIYGDVLVGYMKERVVGNLKIHSMLSTKPSYISIWLRIKFILWVFLKGSNLINKNSYDLIWHNGPYAINETFNLLILKYHALIPSIIGPIVSPHTLLPDDESRSMGKKDNSSNYLEKIIKSIDKYVYRLNWLGSKLSKKTLDATTIIIAKDQSALNILRSQNYKNLLQITIGPNVASFTKKPRILQKSSLIKIITVGYLVERKAVEDVIYAVHYLINSLGMINIHLDVVGDGPLHESLEMLVSKLNIKEYVTFKGFIPKNKIHLLYEEANLFVSGSISESMPAMYLEAMASSLPMVVANNNTSEELRANKFGGLVVPIHSPMMMAKAIKLILDNKQKYEKFSVQNSQLTQTIYSFSNQMNKMVSIMRSQI